MTWFASVKAEIDALPREDGWLDGEGSAVTDVARFVAAAWAHALAERFGEEPRVFPAEDGGVSLEWLWLEGAVMLVSVEVDFNGDVSLVNVADGRGTGGPARTIEQVHAALSRVADEARLIAWMRSAPVPDTSILAYRPKGNPPDA